MTQVFPFENTRQSKWESKSRQGDEYFLVEYDARGRLLNEEVCDQIQHELNDPTYTDVLVIAHGYSTKLKEDGSHGVANNMVPSFQATIPAYRKCLYVAIAWPSDVPTTLFQGDDKAPRELVLGMLKELGELAEKAESSRFYSVFKVSDKIEKLQDLIEHILTDETASKRFHDDDDELPHNLSRSIAELSNELRKQHAGEDGSSKTMLDANAHGHETAESVNRLFRTYSGGSKKAGTENEVSPRTLHETPGDTVVVDRGFSLRRGAISVLTSGGRVSKTYTLLMTLFDCIYNTFERRATVVGSRGVHDLIAFMMRHAHERARFHLFSHSMGTHVVQSAALGREGEGSILTRRFHTLMMAQPACSTDVYAKGGPYRPLVSKLCPVAGPIMATIMQDDEALMLYDWFRTKPLGKFGFFSQEPFKKQEITVFDVPEEKEAQLPIRPIKFEKKTVYNLRAKSVISNHGDFYDKELTSLFWQSAIINMDEDDYKIADPSTLPKNFWTDYEVRNEGKFEDGWFWE